jgi:hypothetical protein
MQNYKMTH